MRAAVDETKFLLTVDRLREATQISLKHDPVKSIKRLADKFQLTENNAVTAASKIAKSYERATDLEPIGGVILSLPVPQNMLPPPTVTAYQSLPEYQMSA